MSIMSSSATKRSVLRIVRVGERGKPAALRPCLARAIVSYHQLPLKTKTVTSFLPFCREGMQTPLARHMLRAGRAISRIELV